MAYGREGVKDDVLLWSQAGGREAGKEDVSGGKTVGYICSQQRSQFSADLVQQKKSATLK